MTDSCPDDDDVRLERLTRRGRGEVRADEHAALDAHLARCGKCREMAADLARLAVLEGWIDDPDDDATQVDVVLDGRFRLDARVAAGGMGAVHRGLDFESGAVVAIKLVHPHLVGDARFARESRILASITDPGIVGYVAHGVTREGQGYLVTEWLDGETLADRIQGGQRLATSSALALIRRVAESLARVHAQGLVHRDLKPANLFLVGRDPLRPKILDFGLARPLDRGADTRLTASGVAVGTPGNMAPEQARGRGDVDARADVFSLGCVLHRCLLGRPPFDGASALSVILKTVLGRPPELALDGVLAPPLAALLARMIAREPTGRLADGAAVARALDALESSAASGGGSSDGPVRLGDDEVVGASLVLARIEHGVASATPAALVRRHAGRFEQLPDGTLAGWFAAPGEALHRALQAARCARALQSALPAARVVVTSGAALSEGQRDVGGLIDRASELIRADGAIDGTVRVDAVTKERLADHFEVDTTDSGLALGREREATLASPLCAVAPLMGRDRELAALDADLDAVAQEGVRRIVLLTAHAGMGKSRLAQEWLRSLSRRAEPVEIWSARADVGRADVPFAVVADGLRAAAGLHADDDDGGVCAARLVERFGARLEPWLEFVGELVGARLARGSRLAPTQHDPGRLGLGIRRAVVEIAAEGRGPLVVAVDDAQWADRASVDALVALLDADIDRPVLLLVAARPEVTDRFPSLATHAASSHVRLGRLSTRASTRLLEHVLGRGVDAAVADELRRKSDGNPFCLLQLASAVADGRTDGLPEAVVDIARARLGWLDAGDRRLLRTASIFGDEFEIEALFALSGDPSAAALDDTLARLEERDLVVRVRSAAPGRRYRFGHALLREAAYGQLTAEDRVLGHRLAGRWLAARAGAADPRVVAEHLERGGAPDETPRWWRLAAESSLAAGEVHDAIACATRALERGAHAEDAARAHLVRARVHTVTGKHRARRDEATAARDLFPRHGPGWCVAHGERAAALALVGDNEAFVAAVGELEAVTVTDEVRAPWVGAAAPAVSLLVFAGLVDRADALLAAVDQVAAPARGQPLVDARLHQAHAARTSAHAPLRSMRHRQLSAEAFARLGELREMMQQQSNLGGAQLDLGLLDEAEATLRGVVRDAERSGAPILRVFGSINLGDTLARRAGSLREAERVLLSAVAEAATQDHRRATGVARTLLAECLLASGDPSGAEHQARLAVDLAAESPPSRAVALAALADAQLAQRETADALASAARARELADRQAGAQERDGWISAVHAEALWAAGRVAEARAVAARALTEIDRRVAEIDDPQVREAFLANVPENRRLRARWGS